MSQQTYNKFHKQLLVNWIKTLLRFEKNVQ